MNVYAKDLLRRVMLLWLGAEGRGCVLNNLFEGERRTYKDGTFYVKPEMLKTSAIFPFKYMKNSVSRTFCLE